MARTFYMPSTMEYAFKFWNRDTDWDIGNGSNYVRFQLGQTDATKRVVVWKMNDAGNLTDWYTTLSSVKVGLPVRLSDGPESEELLVGINVRFTAYLYSSDGTLRDQETANPPSSYIKKVTVNKEFNNFAWDNVNFTFSGLTISPSRNLCVRVEFYTTDVEDPHWLTTGVMGEILVTTDGTIYPATLSHTPTSGIKTGDNVQFSIYNRNNRSLTLRLKYGSRQLATLTANSDTCNIVCQESWFTTAGVSGTSMQVTVDIAEVPNVTDTFTLAKLIPTISITPSSINVGSSVKVTIGSRGGRTLSMKFKYGSTTLKTVSVTSDSVTVTCPRSWFSTAGVTGVTMTVTVAIEAYSVSSSFTLNEIVPTLMLSPATVSTGDTLTIKIGNRDSRSLTLRLKYGSTQLTTVTGNADSVTVSCLKSWFTTANVAQASSMTVSVTIDGFNTAASFTLKAGTDMKPTVGTVTSTPVQQGPAVTSFPNAYLKSITKVKFAVAVTKGSNSNISTVSAKITGGELINLSYNSSTQKYEGTLGPVTGDGYTITVTDARGLTGTKTGTVGTVYQYTAPAISVDTNKTYRCDSSGTKTAGGSWYRAQAKATVFTGLSGNVIEVFTVKLSGSSDEVNLTSDVQSTAHETSVASGEKMDLVFTLTDTVGYTTERTITLEPGGTWLEINQYSGPGVLGDSGTSIGLGITHRAAGGLNCIDMALVNDGMSYYGESGYLLNGISAMAFPMIIKYTSGDGTSFGKNFKNVNRNRPLVAANATAHFLKPASDSAWSGFPSDLSGVLWEGIRFVIWHGPGVMLVILEIRPVLGRIWITDGYDNSWYTWKSITPA